MDTARQFLRYSIPGSVFLLSLIAMQIAWNRTLGVSVQQAAKSVSAGVVLAALAAGIPIGFLFYQLYFGRYGPLTRSAWTLWSRLHPRRDRGAHVLAFLSCEQRIALVRSTGQRIDHRPAYLDHKGPFRAIRPLKLRADWPNKDCPEGHCGTRCKAYLHSYDDGWTIEAKYRLRWDSNWQIIMAVADIRGDDARFVAVKREYTSLSDIYHALGVSRIALLASVGVWGSYNLTYNRGPIVADPARFLTFTATVLALLVIALWYVSEARSKTQMAMLNRLGMSLRALLPKY